jgi:hypothetical protein
LPFSPKRWVCVTAYVAVSLAPESPNWLRDRLRLAVVPVPPAVRVAVSVVYCVFEPAFTAL